MASPQAGRVYIPAGLSSKSDPDDDYSGHPYTAYFVVSIMFHHAIADRMSFIKDIQLAPPHRHQGGIAHAQNEESATVNGGSLISFVGNMTGQMKVVSTAQFYWSAVWIAHMRFTLQEDVLYSTLFAQLAANSHADRQSESTKWYDHYKYVLENVGWKVQSFEYVAGISCSTSGYTFICAPILALLPSMA